MLTLLASFFVIALALLGMAVGVLFGRRPITGSCGGLNRAGLGVSCLFCTRPCREAAPPSNPGSRDEEPVQ